MKLLLEIFLIAIFIIIGIPGIFALLIISIDVWKYLIKDFKKLFKL